MLVKHHACGMHNNVNSSAVVARCAGCHKTFDVDHAITVDRLEAQFASFDSFLQALVREIVTSRPEQEELAGHPSMPMADQSGVIQLIGRSLVFTFLDEQGEVTRFLSISPPDTRELLWRRETVEGTGTLVCVYSAIKGREEQLAQISLGEFEAFQARVGGVIPNPVKGE